ncbi:maleylacetoacetate isomerase [Thermomonas sp.]|uniref:maleylacetoacetate isomerase n=1 Tax=Thermomonas sp. TaxID=1971895 RepID=UPI001D5E949C|nr:maleylacetoacetate isomerase [Thermomonas sp.]MBZ0086646.1 maleylacetoacetate isomerase [Thermomonas sp.]MCO5055337.1 maleylacetoacetate isomerase [Thermomonas sp.]HRO62451.1 maleylacetoacetate isomerase [Thermomonas sp.]
MGGPKFDKLQLYSYWRSSAAYRVRIGLNLKGLDYEIIPVHLVRDGGQQHAPEYRAINPQELVPTLLHGQRRLTQSLSILEYLDEVWPDRPLLPATARERQRARALGLLVACDIHPLNNLRVLQYFEREWHVPQPERDGWVRHWIEAGFRVAELQLADHPSTGTYCDGDTPGFSDCCLIPQIYNARRHGVDMTAYPALCRIEAECLALPEFDAARPENQPDAH